MDEETFKRLMKPELERAQVIAKALPAKQVKPIRKRRLARREKLANKER